MTLILIDSFNAGRTKQQECDSDSFTKVSVDIKVEIKVDINKFPQ